MRRMVSWSILWVVPVALAGCSNPAADKPEAVVSEAQPVEDGVVEVAAVDADGAPTAAEDLEVLEITPENSKIAFVGSKVTGSHDGGFRQFHGHLELSPDGEVRRITADIDMDSTWSDNDKLTEHLKNEDFFDVPKFPTSSFVTTEITPGGPDGATHTITGNLTLHGVTKSITFPATLAVDANEARLDSEFFLRRKDFGIEYSGKADDLIRDEVVLKLSVRSPRSS